MMMILSTAHVEERISWWYVLLSSIKGERHVIFCQIQPLTKLTGNILILVRVVTIITIITIISIATIATVVTGTIENRKNEWISGCATYIYTGVIMSLTLKWEQFLPVPPQIHLAPPLPHRPAPPTYSPSPHHHPPLLRPTCCAGNGIVYLWNLHCTHTSPPPPPKDETVEVLPWKKVYSVVMN